jgi:hypothetical protein
VIQFTPEQRFPAALGINLLLGLQQIAASTEPGAGCSSAWAASKRAVALIESARDAGRQSGHSNPQAPSARPDTTERVTEVGCALFLW